MNAFVQHVIYDFKTGIRDRGKLLMYYLFPLVFFVLVGGLMVSINPYFKQTMIPAMVLFAYMSASLLSFPGTLVQARESGVLRSMRVNGVPAVSVLGSPVLSTAVHMGIITVIMAAAGMRLFGAAAPVSAGGFAGIALLSYLLYASIGMLIGVVAGSSSSSMMISQLIYIPSIILGGLMVPASALPSPFTRIAQIMPASHCMRLFASFGFGGGEAEAISICVVSISILINFALAVFLFRWDSGKSRPSTRIPLVILALLPYVAAFILAGLSNQ